MLNGMDISHYQNGINVAAVPCDFVITKATQGTTFVDPACDNLYQQAKKAGKLLGVYHYAGGGGAVQEADFFLKNIQGYIGEAILILDWEAGQNPNFGNPSYALAFLDRVKEKTGIKPLIYMSQSVCASYDWSGVVNGDYALWMAQYANDNATGYQSNPWYRNSLGAFRGMVMLQYTSNGTLPNYGARLDLDLFYGDANAWHSYAGTKTEPTEPIDEQHRNVYANGKRREGYSRWWSGKRAFDGKEETFIRNSKSQGVLSVQDGKAEAGAKVITFGEIKPTEKKQLFKYVPKTMNDVVVGYYIVSLLDENLCLTVNPDANYNIFLQPLNKIKGAKDEHLSVWMIKEVGTGDYEGLCSLVNAQTLQYLDVGKHIGSKNQYLD